MLAFAVSELLFIPKTVQLGGSDSRVCCSRRLSVSAVTLILRFPEMSGVDSLEWNTRVVLAYCERTLILRHLYWSA